MKKDHELTSQKSFKMTGNMSNLEDSVGVIGSSLSKVQILLSQGQKTQERRPNKFSNQRQTIGNNQEIDSKSRSFISINK